MRVKTHEGLIKFAFFAPVTVTSLIFRFRFGFGFGFGFSFGFDPIRFRFLAAPSFASFSFLVGFFRPSRDFFRLCVYHYDAGLNGRANLLCFSGDVSVVASHEKLKPEDWQLACVGTGASSQPAQYSGVTFLVVASTILHSVWQRRPAAREV
ncbi:LAFA_0G20406g1_1 [Lachancea sp. 'fantastica']|nr:LAFA_0G20406g1_1 [Lachancea sp. 'fantastica']